MQIEELGKKIKAKYPQYNDLSDFEVGQKSLKYYPQYNDLVDDDQITRLRIGEPVKVGVKEVIREVPTAIKKVAGGIVKTFVPGITEFFKTTGNVIGEGLAYAVDPVVREQYAKGELGVLPTITETTPIDVAKKTVAAGLEVAIYKAIPLSKKYPLIVRFGKGFLEGVGSAVAEGLAKDQSFEEITRNARTRAVFGAAFEAAYPYIARVLSVDITKVPSTIKKQLGEVIGEIKVPLKAPKVLEEIIPTEIPIGIKPKKFIETVKKSAQTTKELKGVLGEIYPLYEPITNKEAIVEADTIIKRSVDLARRRVLSDEPVSALKSALSIRLMKHFEAEKNLDATLEILDNYTNQLRAGGQFIQAASLWNKLAPESLVSLGDKIAKKHGTELTLETKKVVLEQLLKIEKMKPGPTKDKATLEVLGYIADKIPLRPGELFDVFRYNNMLSSPMSNERNIAGNLWQTYVTRPLDLLSRATYDFIRHPFNPMVREVYFSDIPHYYKGAFFSISDATEAFREGFRRGHISEKILDVGNTTDIIGTMRRAKAPLIISAAPRFMEAQDNFFSVLIGSGEKARLMARGIPEKQAIEQATELAERYLYRQQLGVDSKTQSLFVRALDELGNMVYRIRRYPVIGKPWGWAVPFVRTPINIAKEGIKRSPLGLIGGSYSAEQISQALLGTIVTAIGAGFAIQDRTTYMPPMDPTARKLFYDSGKKAFSIRIGDAWVPMWYFGPFAIALALPAAVNYYYTETRTSPTESELNKLVNTILGSARIITAQTPLSGISSFFQAIQGDVDYSLPGQIAWTLKQAIPFQGLIRYINSWLDPIYRRSTQFMEALKRDLPILSKDLPAIETSTGEPAERKVWDLLLPWSIGIKEEEFEDLYETRIKRLQELERLRTEREKYGPAIRIPSIKW